MEGQYNKITIDTVEAAIERFDFDKDFDFRVDAVLNATSPLKPVIEIHYRNPELAGTWMLSYPLSPKCFKMLLDQKLITRDRTSEQGDRMYRLVK